MSMGQMVEDVRLAVNGMADVSFYGRTGGAVPTPTEILKRGARGVRTSRRVVSEDTAPGAEAYMA